MTYIIYIYPYIAQTMFKKVSSIRQLGRTPVYREPRKSKASGPINCCILATLVVSGSAGRYRASALSLQPRFTPQ